MNFRKTLLAGTAATAIAFSGAPVASAESEPMVVDSQITTAPTEEEVDTSSDPAEIREWISVFTSVINAMTTTYNFVDRYVLD
ncbi:hypothetical protein [Corynebacterium guangdongense]|uniref:Uncharacterized protein n=1 Tax=Corynebacterium guangdongense TaxID=1783348 RepID=A0ABU1ZWY7_9CORY|nr:hypothetical protein [Corynebacterium guangdongense]MDR7329453.1 hypothetical protein [Corynebacterium guangdongense]